MKRCLEVGKKHIELLTMLFECVTKILFKHDFGIYIFSTLEMICNFVQLVILLIFYV